MFIVCKSFAIIFCGFFVIIAAENSPEIENVVLESELRAIVLINKYSSLHNTFTLICSANVLDNKSFLVSPECRKRYHHYRELFVTRFVTSDKIYKETETGHQVYEEKTYYNKLGDDAYNNFTILRIASPLNNVQPVKLPEDDMKYNGKLKTYREIPARGATKNTSSVKVFSTDIIDGEKCVEIFAKEEINLHLGRGEKICSFTQSNTTKNGNLLGGAFCEENNSNVSILCFTHYPWKYSDGNRNLPEVYLSLRPIISWIKEGKNLSSSNNKNSNNNNDNNSTIPDDKSLTSVVVFYVTIVVTAFSFICIGYDLWKKTGYRDIVTRVYQDSTYP